MPTPATSTPTLSVQAAPSARFAWPCVRMRAKPHAARVVAAGTIRDAAIRVFMADSSFDPSGWMDSRRHGRRWPVDVVHRAVDSHTRIEGRVSRRLGDEATLVTGPAARLHAHNAREGRLAGRDGEGRYHAGRPDLDGRLRGPEPSFRGEAARPLGQGPHPR